MVQKCAYQEPLQPRSNVRAVDRLQKQQQQNNFKQTSKADQKYF
jgi:hypothetical protein